MDAAGATYIARWTSVHSRNVTQSIEEALLRKVFSFIEIISPCTTLYLRRNRPRDGVDMLQHYQENTILKHGADTRETAIDYQGKIVIGKFVDKNKPSYLEASDKCSIKLVGDDYQLYGKTIPNGRPRKKPRRSGSPLVAPQWQRRSAGRGSTCQTPQSFCGCGEESSSQGCEKGCCRTQSSEENCSKSQAREESCSESRCQGSGKKEGCAQE